VVKCTGDVDRAGLVCNDTECCWGRFLQNCHLKGPEREGR
jgi:hypothetical protein